MIWAIFLRSKLARYGLIAVAIVAVIGAYTIKVQRDERAKIKAETDAARVENLKEDQTSDTEIENSPLDDVIDRLGRWIMPAGPDQ